MLEARDLHTRHGASHVLHGVSLAVEAGEAVALMGRNGMGKTTLLRSLMGLTPPCSGLVLLDGRDVTGMAPYWLARQGLGWVPEGRGIFPNLTVRETLVMAARPGLWGLPEVLDLFPRLAERLSNMGDQLSGGEQQMLTIGRALMTNPRLLLLDEATEGLAPLMRCEIWRALQALRAGGMAMVVVDKDVAALTGLCGRAVILAKGRVVFEGDAAVLAADKGMQQAYLGV